ncbi:MAG: hypothetical protein U9N42_08485, partial [Campylobacterota bacterium]|nr:hypothetical protein [Campylobacterota bacterium]
NMSIKMLLVLSVIGVFVSGCTRCSTCHTVVKSKPKTLKHKCAEPKKVIVVSQDYYEPTYGCCSH